MKQTNVNETNEQTLEAQAQRSADCIHCFN